MPSQQVHEAQTASHSLCFSKQVEDTFVPALSVKPRVITDPQKAPVIKLFQTTALSSINTAAVFIEQFKKELDAVKEYLVPDKSKLLATLPANSQSQFAYNHISGERIEQFFTQAEQTIKQLNLPAEQKSLIWQEINLTHREFYRNHEVEFGNADTRTYWPYAHEGAFVHIFEKLRNATHETDPKRRYIQNMIDYIYTHKHTPQGNVNEGDIESSLNLRAIDPWSRHVLSMTRDSASSTEMTYVTLQTPSGRYAYRDGEKFFFEDTHKPLSPAEVTTLRENCCSEVVFRPFKKGEKARIGFKFDWDGNRIVSQQPVQTGWWGHCDIKALIETLLADLASCGGVKEYRSDTFSTIELTRADLLEGLAAMLNFDDEYVPVDRPDTPTIKTFGEYTYAGSRFQGSSEEILFKTDKGIFNFDIALTTLYDKNTPPKVVNIRQAFLTKIPNADLTSFIVNPDIVDVKNNDMSYVDASSRRFIGTTKGTTFDAAGNAIDLEARFEIDMSKNSGPKVLIASRPLNIVGRLVERIYYNPANHELSVVNTRFVKKNGEFVPVETEPSSLGTIAQIRLGHEMEENDDTTGKYRMVQAAIQSGDKIAVDSDPGPKVWNGEVHTLAIRTEYRSPDKLWERVSVYSDATYGAKRLARVINQLDASGNIIDCCEVKAAVDFFWKSRPQVAPLVFDKGQWFANKGMMQRGMLELGEGKKNSLAAIEDIYDLVYLGFISTNPSEPLHSIVHEGKRYVYVDEKEWEKDIRLIEGRQTWAERHFGS